MRKSERGLPASSSMLEKTTLEGSKMKKTILAVLTLAAVMAASPAPHNAFTPDTVPYGPAPAFIPAGAQLAVLEGDPTASSGDFTIRLKLPDGYKIPPHWHPTRENVTVISGTFKVGMGDTFDENKMNAFPAGSFAYLDPDMHHYAKAQGPVVVQVHGMSPVQFNYVNPKDDPGRK
jgi:hypothetical protein